jgi:hypothetical protein
MHDGTSQRNPDPQLDEEVWNAWLQKNKTMDRVSAARLRKTLVVFGVLAVLALYMWHFFHVAA